MNPGRKEIAGTVKARRETMGPDKIFRPLPNRLTQAVGPIVLLDHFPKRDRPPKPPALPSGASAHPHRGIVTLTYPISGELLHFDSGGGYGIVRAGGVQWMNAGSGVIHDEQLSVEFQRVGGTVYSFQFWINLPAWKKAQAPEYMPLQPDELPSVALPHGAGTVKILAGTLMGRTSAVPRYTVQFVYHIRLEKGACVALPTQPDLEYAGYLPAGTATVGGKAVGAREFFLLSADGSGIEMENAADGGLDILVFGGEPYTEPMFTHGPFVMNSREEIAQAYADYRQGRYGRIDYDALERLQAPGPTESGPR